jgi:hypothetical protein
MRSAGKLQADSSHLSGIVIITCVPAKADHVFICEAREIIRLPEQK